MVASSAGGKKARKTVKCHIFAAQTYWGISKQLGIQLTSKLSLEVEKTATPHLAENQTAEANKEITVRGGNIWNGNSDNRQLQVATEVIEIFG